MRKEKILGNSIITEYCGNGLYRVVCDNGDNDVMRIPQDYKIGDKGQTIYCSDGKTYGLRSFKKIIQ